MNIGKLAQAEVLRVIPYEYEVYNEATDKNDKIKEDVRIWFLKNQLNYKAAQDFGDAQKGLSDDDREKAMAGVILSKISRWSLKKNETESMPIDAEGFGALPPDLLALIVTEFTGLLGVGGNPTKPAS